MINDQGKRPYAATRWGEDSAVVTSRDGYNRNRPTRGSSQSPRDSRRQGAGWELDADELDRYMSGQPAKEPRFDPYGRSQSSGRTERPQQAPRQQPQARQQAPQPQYDDYEDATPQSDGQWVDDDFGYEDDYGYEEFQPEPEPTPAAATQPRRQQRQPVRQRQVEPEYEDDLYEDPYVLDEDEAPRRPQRRQQRPEGRSRPARQAPSFTLPPAITNAPIVKDQTALIMFGVALVSLLAMVIVVATRRDVLGEAIFTYVDANGDPTNFQTAQAIWNIPLIAGMVMLISTILAWFLARWGEFLPRFLLGGSIAVHFVAWIAIIAYLF